MRTIVTALVVAGALVAPAASAPSQGPRVGGTLVIGLPGVEPACLNVLDARCNPVTGVLQQVTSAVFDAPFEVVDGTFRERLASVTYSKRPPFTLTYRIRPEAHWSDRVPITSRDFIFTLRAMRRHGGPLVTESVSSVRSVRRVDAKTFRMVLRPRNAGWRGFFQFVLPEHALRGEDLTKVWTDRIDNPKTRQPIGSGPFLVERWERGRELVLRRNPNYWGPHPAYLERIVARYVGTVTERAAGLRSGELDVALGFNDRDSFAALREDRKFEAIAFEGPTYEHFALRLGPGGHPALKNKLVRRAFAYGVNRVALAQQIWGLHLREPRPLDSVTVLAQSPHYAASWKHYRYRPAQARRLLEQAGCRRGSDGIYECEGQRLSLRVITTSGTAFRVHSVELVQDQLRRAGFEVRPLYVVNPVFFGPGGTVASGNFDVALFSWTPSPDAADLDWVYGCGGVQNFTGYCQRLVTAELDQAGRILDPVQRARVLNRADRQIAKDVPVLPLFHVPASAFRTTAVRGVRVNALFPLTTAENWWLEG